MFWHSKQKSRRSPAPPLCAPVPSRPASGASYLLQSEEQLWQDRRFRQKLLYLLRASLRGVEGLIVTEEHAGGPGTGQSWNVVGHLQTAEGEDFGYQLTFSRLATGHLKILGSIPLKFLGNPLFFGRFALSDTAAGRFHFAEKTNLLSRRASGSQPDRTRVWIDDWILEDVPGGFRLQAGLASGGHTFQLQLELAGGKASLLSTSDVRRPTSDVPLQVHTRLPSKGCLTVDDRTITVTGESWLEIENSPNMAPWPEGIWMGLQLDDGTEWRVCVPRDVGRSEDRTPEIVGGSEDRTSEDGTLSSDVRRPTPDVSLIAPDGTIRPLSPADYRLTPVRSWQSVETQIHYPVTWQLSVHGRELTLEVEPSLLAQELECLQGSLFQYWQGQVQVAGRRGGMPVRGRGFVRLTGYDRESIQEAKALRLFDFLENIRAIKRLAEERAGRPGQEYVRTIDSKLVLYSALLGVLLELPAEALFERGIMKLFVEFRTHVIRVSDDLIEKIVKPAFVPGRLHRFVELLELGQEKYRRAWEKVRRGERLTAPDYERMIPMFTSEELMDAGVSRQELEGLTIEGLDITGNKADVHSGYFTGLPAAIAATGLSPEQTERIFLGWAQGCLAGFRSIVNEERAHDRQYLVVGPPLDVPPGDEMEPDPGNALGIVYDQSGRIFEGVVAALLDVYSPHDTPMKAAYTRFFKYLCIIMQFLDDRNDVGDDWQRATNIVISLAHTHYPEEYRCLCAFLEAEPSPNAAFFGRKGQRRLMELMPRTMAAWQSFMTYFLRLLEANEPFSYEIFYYLIAKRYTDANDERFNAKLRNLRKVAVILQRLVVEGWNRPGMLPGGTETTLLELALLSLVFEEPFLKYRLIDLYWEWRVTATFLGDRLLEEHANELGLDLAEKRWKRRAPGHFFFPTVAEVRDWRLPANVLAQVERMNERIAALERTIDDLPGLDDSQRHTVRSALIGAWDACLQAFFLEERYRVVARRGYQHLLSRRRSPVDWVLQIWDAKNGGMFRQLLKMRHAFPRESSATDHSRFVALMGNYFQALDDLLDARDDYLTHQPNILVAFLIESGELSRLLELDGSGSWSPELLERVAPVAMARWHGLCTELKEAVEDEAPLLISPMLAFLENRALSAGVSPVSLRD